MIYCLILSIAVVLLDQISKIIVVNTIEPYEVIPVIKNVLNFTYIENRGAAFGMLSEQRWIFMIISVVAIVAIFLFIWKEKPRSMWIKTCLGAIVGGGIGNMIDRVFRGSVVDFIEADFVQYPHPSFEGGFKLTMTDFPIFNVADCFITVGCAVLVVYLIFFELPREAKAEKEKKLAKEAEACEKENNEN
ncbi:MAG: signal peptidase II [Clostridia bacterium]|nr:signal peptidase II [Clostridia bacterium]